MILAAPEPCSIGVAPSETWRRLLRKTGRTHRLDDVDDRRLYRTAELVQEREVPTS